MSNNCKTVTLSTRKKKKGTQLSFYLDYYPGYRDESNMKVQRHESLGIYIYAFQMSIYPDTQAGSQLSHLSCCTTLRANTSSCPLKRVINKSTFS